MQEGVGVDPPPVEITTIDDINHQRVSVADTVTPHGSGAVAEPTAPETLCQCMTQLL